MKPAILTILLILLSTRLFSQIEDINIITIINAQYDAIDSIQVIPSDALSGEYDLLNLGFEYDTVKIVNKKSIEISWPGEYIDGSYNLIITPEQIYLRSSHENPNPNFLYWLETITKERYDIISKYLSSLKNNTLKDRTTDFSYQQSYFYNDFKKEKYKNNAWTDNQYKNLVDLLEMINKPLKPGNNCITIPDSAELKKNRAIKIVSYSLEPDDKT